MLGGLRVEGGGRRLRLEVGQLGGETLAESPDLGGERFAVGVDARDASLQIVDLLAQAGGLVEGPDQLLRLRAPAPPRQTGPPHYVRPPPLPVAHLLRRQGELLLRIAQRLDLAAQIGLNLESRTSTLAFLLPHRGGTGAQASKSHALLR